MCKIKYWDCRKTLSVLLLIICKNLFELNLSNRINGNKELNTYNLISAFKDRGLSSTRNKYHPIESKGRYCLPQGLVYTEGRYGETLKNYQEH